MTTSAVPDLSTVSKLTDFTTFTENGTATTAEPLLQSTTAEPPRTTGEVQITSSAAAADPGAEQGGGNIGLIAGVVVAIVIIIVVIATPLCVVFWKRRKQNSSIEDPPAATRNSPRQTKKKAPPGLSTLSKATATIFNLPRKMSTTSTGSYKVETANPVIQKSKSQNDLVELPVEHLNYQGGRRPTFDYLPDVSDIRPPCLTSQGEQEVYMNTSDVPESSSVKPKKPKKSSKKSTRSSDAPIEYPKGYNPFRKGSGAYVNIPGGDTSIAQQETIREEDEEVTQDITLPSALIKAKKPAKKDGPPPVTEVQVKYPEGYRADRKESTPYANLPKGHSSLRAAEKKSSEVEEYCQEIYQNHEAVQQAKPQEVYDVPPSGGQLDETTGDEMYQSPQQFQNEEEYEILTQQPGEYLALNRRDGQSETQGEETYANDEAETEFSTIQKTGKKMSHLQAFKQEFSNGPQLDDSSHNQTDFELEEEMYDTPKVQVRQDSIRHNVNHDYNDRRS